MNKTSKWKSAKESGAHRLKGFIAPLTIEPAYELSGKPATVFRR